MTRLPGRLCFVAVLAVLASTRPALASDVADACIGAHVDGQVLVKAEKLVAARERFSSCALDACPDVIQKECADLVADVEHEIPTLVFTAIGSDSQPLVEAHVEVDGRLVQTRLDGSALRVDPGRRHVRFTVGDASRELTIDVPAGRKDQRVEVSFAEPLPFQLGERDQAAGFDSSLIAPLAALGVGVAALGSFGYFALHGKSIESDLEACKPECAPSDVDRMQTSYLAADISLGVSLIAFGTGAFLFLRREGAEQTSVPSVGAAFGRDGFEFTARGRF